MKKDFDYDQCHVRVETSKQLVNAMRDAKGRGIVRLQGLLQICQEELNFQGSTDETIRPELRDLRIIGTTIPAFRESKLRRASSSAGSSQTMDEVEDDGYEIEDVAPPTKMPRKATPTPVPTRPIIVKLNVSSPTPGSSSSSSSSSSNRLVASSAAQAATNALIAAQVATTADKKRELCASIKQYNVNDFEEDA